MASARENGHVLMKYVRGEYKSARCHPPSESNGLGLTGNHRTD